MREIFFKNYIRSQLAVYSSSYKEFVSEACRLGLIIRWVITNTWKCYLLPFYRNAKH